MELIQGQGLGLGGGSHYSEAGSQRWRWGELVVQGRSREQIEESGSLVCELGLSGQGSPDGL